MILNICTNSNVLTVFYYVKIGATIISIVVPILLMYKLIKILSKHIFNGEPLTKDMNSIAKTIIAALVVFLVPTIANGFFKLVDNYSDQEVVDCYLEANLENIKSLREKEKKELQERMEKQAMEAKKAAEEQARKRAEENAQKKKKNNDAKTNDSTTESDSSSSTINIIIGDSRMVGLCATLTGDWTKCEYSSSGGYHYQKIYFVAQGSMSYSWFSNTAVGAVNNILKNNSDKKFNIITNMGVNMLLYDVEKYISKYNELIDNQWKEESFVIVSVTPVDENKQTKDAYFIKNVDIETFNNKIRNGVKKAKYCDIYNQIKNNFNTTDGVHYTSETYQDIYQKILNCL